MTRWILKSSESRLSLSNEGSGFSITKYYNESNGSKDSTESLSVETYISVVHEVENPSVIRSISFISMSIDPDCDS